MFRLVLRCRADARKRFAAKRSDVLVKLELLDNKHVQDIVHQLRRLMANLTQFHLDCHKLFHGVKLFPIEMDLAKSAFQTSEVPGEFHDHVSDGEEVREEEDQEIIDLDTPDKGDLLRDISGGGNENLQLLPGLGGETQIPTNNNPDTAKLLDL